MAHYLSKIAGGLQKDLGDKMTPNAKKLKNDNALDDLFQSEESIMLQNASRHLTEKIEIIGMNLINNKKFKTQATS